MQQITARLINMLRQSASLLECKHPVPAIFLTNWTGEVITPDAAYETDRDALLQRLFNDCANAYTSLPNGESEYKQEQMKNLLEELPYAAQYDVLVAQQFVRQAIPHADRTVTFILHNGKQVTIPRKEE